MSYRRARSPQDPRLDLQESLAKLPSSLLILCRLRGEYHTDFGAIRVPARRLRKAATVPAVSRGLHQLSGCHTVPGGGGPGTEDGSAGMPGLLHVGCLPEYAGRLPLPREQGKKAPHLSLLCTHIHPISRSELRLGEMNASLTSLPQNV